MFCSVFLIFWDPTKKVESELTLEK